MLLPLAVQLSSSGGLPGALPGVLPGDTGSNVSLLTLLGPTALKTCGALAAALVGGRFVLRRMFEVGAGVGVGVWGPRGGWGGGWGGEGGAPCRVLFGGVDDWLVCVGGGCAALREVGSPRGPRPPGPPAHPAHLAHPTHCTPPTPLALAGKSSSTLLPEPLPPPHTSPSPT